VPASATLSSFVRRKFIVLFVEANIQGKLTLIVPVTQINSVATLALDVLIAKIRLTQLTLSSVRYTFQ